MSTLRLPLADIRPLVVVPVYNHAGTLRRVVEGVLQHTAHVLVVDDGSSDLPDAPKGTGGAAQGDLPPAHPLHGLDVVLLRHERNQGKGAAIRSAAAFAESGGFTHIITIDADAQHDPADLPLFLQAITQAPSTLWVGARRFPSENVPFSSRFGRAFSNFWFKVQTGQGLADTQCGFRAYPVCLFSSLHFTETRYSFETEVLVKSAWAGFAVADISISVVYPPKNERISHFRALSDNVRISLLNTRLTMRSMVPLPQKRYAVDAEGRVSALHPLRSLRLLLREETPGRVGASVGLGMFLGMLPLVGVQTITLLLLAGRLRLNKAAALAACQLCTPPIAPALCVEAGHYLRHGAFLTEISWQTLGHEAPQRVGDWLLGSLVMAPLAAVLLGPLVWVCGLLLCAGVKKYRGGEGA